MIALTYIDEAERARGRDLGRSLIARRGFGWGQDGESNGVPGAQKRCPAAVSGVAEIAERFENVGSGNLTFVAGSGAMAAPSAAERKPRGMRPVSAFQSSLRHEIGTGHVDFFRRRILRDWPL